MTAQTSEVLIYKNEELMLFSEPLEGLFEKLHPTYEPLNFSTACWRGYIGTWKIENNKLYLTKVESVRYEDEESDLCLTDLFPDSSGDVFAIWYSGTLICPMGDVIENHAGFGSTYERELLIEIENGFVTREDVIKNSKETQLKNQIVDLPAFLSRQAD